MILPLKVGDIVASKLGHDRKKLMVVVATIGEYRVVVADGKTRPLAKGKQKNVNHVKFKAHNEEIAARIEANTLEDCFIRKTIGALLAEFNEGESNAKG
ncbi:MAG: hypothetical protein PHX51_04725 [Clostridia bacterium]|nr:hypothetical protein [Clostridia bacterium]